MSSLLTRILPPVGLVLLLLLIGFTGCEEPGLPSAQTNVLLDTRRPNDLEQALDFLGRLDEFETMQAQQKIQYHLQQWLKRRTPDDSWQPDPMVVALDHPLTTHERLTRMEFDSYDVQTLQETTWFRDVARSTLENNEVSPDLMQKISDAVSAVGPSTADELAHAMRLFDWTVRNLILDDIDGQSDTGRRDATVSLDAWESLLMGRGTIWEKSRVFISLSRQIGLRVVMLAVDNGTSAPRPWLPAVMIGDQLYLFDMRLATPLVGRDGNSIATLTEVIDHPEILSRLAEQSGEPYPISSSDLDRIVALVDAPPGSMSLRMAMLEGVLMGDRKMVITVAPTSMAALLSECRGINDTQIWRLPYDAVLVRGALPPETQMWILLEHRLYDRTTPLAKARLLYFRGQLDPHEEQPGARQLYMECRAPNIQIESIRGMSLQVPEGAPRPTQQQLEVYEERVNDLANFMVRTKQNATYWLGLIAFDQGSYDVAVDYFSKRIIEAYPQSMWTTGATYNLARSYEAVAVRDNQPDDWQRALETYRSISQSPWTPACRLRAFAIEQRLESQRSQGGEAGSEAESPELSSANNDRGVRSRVMAELPPDA